MEAFYGTMTACEVAYYTYVYSKVDKKYYKIVSSHMKIACLIGRLISALLAQTLIDKHVLTVAHLNYLTLASKIFYYVKDSIYSLIQFNMFILLQVQLYQYCGP